ncbi:hypothetical protein MSAN_00057200 [Mycena sanguinolenta]|uniref:Uncharacterized protein n=1 Tax=Mycena sanguinolenta TaxID=230812 RepID=A0A8H6ZFF3_9AGAR|nr:hypothetical protein MSAN_00057200 [Mycena sanguinolenta]
MRCVLKAASWSSAGPLESSHSAISSDTTAGWYCISLLDELDIYASQSPVTPQRRTAPVASSPKNNHAERRRRILPRDPVTPNVQSLAQADARLIHERLQQNHTHLQVQLHARSPPVPTGHVKAFLDSAFRTYASRIQSEFTSLRAACVRAVQSERHQTAQLRSACARLTRERDVAEDKLRVLLDQRDAVGKRTRAQVEKEDADEDEETALLYPLSPVSPRPMPTQSPPPRLMSPFVLTVCRSPSHTPDPEDKTGFDLTIPGDSLPPPSKKRRINAPECALEPTPGDPSAPVTTERETCPAAGFGECDMDLESASESSECSDTECSESSNSSSSRSKATSSSFHPISSSPPPFIESKASLHCRRPTPPSPPRLHLPLEYVDIMYQPSDGKLVCRVCLLGASSGGDKSSACAGPIKAFLPGASWDVLRKHCEEMHAEACQDVVGLGQQGVQELRRRLGLAAGAPAPAAYDFE